MKNGRNAAHSTFFDFATIPEVDPINGIFAPSSLGIANVFASAA
jgi:hypothetical protein